MSGLAYLGLLALAAGLLGACGASAAQPTVPAPGAQAATAPATQPPAPTGAAQPAGADGSKPVVITAAGAKPDDIRAKVEEYRALLGGPDNGGTPGTQPSGYRSINWDGLPDELSAPNLYAPDFFNDAKPPRARGALLATPGQGLMVSADSENPAGAQPRFGNINDSYSNIFTAYSGERMFSPVGSNIVDLTFFVPGTQTPAVVRGFGAVYADVDTDHTAFEYFDAAGKSLGTFATPISDNGLSFLGVAFPEPIVHRVRIAYGTTALGPADGPQSDVAVMDDFIYGEPQAIP